MQPETPAPNNEPAVTPQAPETPAAQPSTPEPAAQAPQQPAQPAAAAPAEPTPAPAPAAADDEDPTIANVAGSSDEPEDQLSKQIAARGDDLPQGVNADGTIDPQVYAYESLPDIEVRGKIGNGKVQTFTVKTADDLPDDFRFASAKDQARFTQDLGQNVSLTAKLIEEANAYNKQRESELSQRQTATSQKSEILKLQESGKLPKFGVEPLTADGKPNPEFMNDPGAKRAQQVLDHIKEVNAQLEQAGASDRVTSITLGLQLLEAKEAIEAKQGRISGIADRRSQITGSTAGGSAPTNTGGTPQRVHRNVQAAVAAGLRRAGMD